MSIRVLNDATEPLYYVILDELGQPFTGLSNLGVYVSRLSDDYILDWSDVTFKASGWATKVQAVTEVDATNQPGLYTVTGGLDLSAIPNMAADDTLLVTVGQSPSTDNILVATQEIKVGQWPDAILADTAAMEPLVTAYVDAAISSRESEVDAASRAATDQAEHDATQLAVAAVQADTDDIQTRLPAALVGGRMDADVGNIQSGVVDSDAIAADAIGAAELATTAVEEIRDAILADSTPFDGADIAAILADTAAMEPVVTSNLDVAVSTRSDFDEATDPVELLDSGGSAGTSASELVVDIDTQLATAHGSGAWDGTESDWSTAEREQIRDALGVDGTKTAATGGQVQDILADTAAIQPTVATNLDAAITSRAVPGDAMSLVVGAIDSAVLSTTGLDAIADAVWDELLAGHLGAGSTGEALNNGGGAGAITPAQIADAVWDEPTATHTDPGSFGKAAGDNLDAAISSRAVAGDAMDLIAGSVDANALDVTAVAEIVDGVWDEALAGHVTAGSTGQALGRVDVDLSSRAAPGDAMALIANALNAVAIATSGANEIADAVWDELLAGHVVAGSAGEAQARLDAAITTRTAPGDAMSLTAGERVVVVDAVWDELTAGHTTAGTTGKALLDAGVTADPNAIADAVWDESAAAHAVVGSMGQLQNRLDANISSRAAPGAQMDLQANAIDASALATSGLDAIADSVWDEAISGHSGAGSAGLELQNKAEPSDAMDLITDAVDATSLADAGRDKIVDQVWRETLADHSSVVGSTAEALNSVTAPASPSVIADAVWDELLAGHVVAGSAGEALGKVDVVVSSRAAPGAAMDLVANAVDATALAADAVTKIQSSILSDATPFAGANIDASVSSRATQVTADDILADTAALDARLPSDPADESHQLAQHSVTQSLIGALNDPAATTVAAAVWDELLAGHLAPGSTGEALQNAGATADPTAIADAVWDEAAADHTAVGSMGEAQNAAATAAADIAKIDSAPTLAPNAAVTGSLLDRLANKDAGKTYDQSTDSLEAMRDRIG